MLNKVLNAWILLVFGYIFLMTGKHYHSEPLLVVSFTLLVVALVLFLLDIWQWLWEVLG